MKRDTEDESQEEDEENIEHLGTYQARCRKKLECCHERVSGEFLNCHGYDLNCDSKSQLQKHMNARHPSNPKKTNSNTFEIDAEEINKEKCR